MQKFLSNIGFWILLVVAIPILFFLGSDTVETMPSKAIVFVNLKTKEYYAPPYLIKNSSRFNAYDFNQMFVETARNMGANPNRECRDEGYFVGATQSSPLHFLSRYGLWFKWNARWDDDGNWNW